MKPLVYVQAPGKWSVEAAFRWSGFPVTQDYEEADVIAFTGGEDINPAIYGEKSDRSVQWTSYQRDAIEINTYKNLRKDQFKFGICRGGQLLNCLNGGKLWQDVNNHHGSHPIYDIPTGRILQTTSVHHQAMRPGPGAEIVAISSESTRKRAERDEWRGSVTNILEGQDIEVLWYPADKALCIQGHPEYHDITFREYCFELLERYI